MFFIFSLILDNERWKQADVPSELQSLVDSLVDGKNDVNFSAGLLCSFLFFRFFTFEKNILLFFVCVGIYPRGKEPKFSIGQYVWTVQLQSFTSCFPLKALPQLALILSTLEELLRSMYA